MADWRTEDEIANDDRRQPWVELEVVLLLIGMCALVLRALGILA